ncbi:MAG: hypothetical protein IKI35_00855 [Stomatobaculum sp.]|jgi:hypothetical protein|nr:hypothetical protein [Stomatobaculum sp.]
MKRLKKAVYSACFIAGAVQLTACTQKLYGPPPTSAAVSPTEEVTSTEEVLPTEEVPEVVYGPPPGAQFEQPVTQYEPSEEVPEDVYGPPEFFGEPAEEAAAEEKPK